MATYLFCLFRNHAEPPAALTGVAGAPVRAIRAGRITAWVATVAERPDPSAASLRDHDAVTTAALATGETPLPVRFGEAFESDEACGAAVADHEADYLAALGRLAGRVEMTVAIALRALAPADDSQPVEPDAATPGRAYLERLRGGHREGQGLRQQGHVLARPVENAVRGLVLDERVTMRSDPPTYLLSHLVARETVSEYLRLVTAVIGGRPPGEPPLAAVRGPSAPYSFVAEAP